MPMTRKQLLAMLDDEEKLRAKLRTAMENALGILRGTITPDFFEKQHSLIEGYEEAARKGAAIGWLEIGLGWFDEHGLTRGTEARCSEAGDADRSTDPKAEG